jgi:probable F420-dependent oxidoreductase
MTEVAGEMADGYVFHPFTTQRYLQEVTLPALARGRKVSGRESMALTGPVLVATGGTEADLTTAIAGTRRRIAFYASTPAYRKVLEIHGWGELQPELATLARQGGWDAMGELVPDDLLHAVAVVGPTHDIAEELYRRLGATAESITLSVPYPHDPAIWAPIARAVREISIGQGVSSED